MSIVYLADGREIRTEVQDSYGIGEIEIEGRKIRVERLPEPYQYRGYGELVSIKLASGVMMGAILQPHEYIHHRTTVDIGAIEAEAVRRRNPGDVVVSKSKLITAVYDQAAKQWHEEEQPMDQSNEQHTPTSADEALYAGMLTTQTIGAIQQAYTDGKIADIETYNHLYAEAKKADVQVQKLARLLEQEKEEQKEYEAWKLQRDVKAATEVFKGMVNWQEEGQSKESEDS